MRKVKLVLGNSTNSTLSNMKKLNNFAVRKHYVILVTFVTMLKKTTKRHLTNPFKSIYFFRLSYLCELAKVDKNKLHDILRPNKAIYVSSPFESRVLESKVGEKSMFAFDESVEWEE